MFNLFSQPASAPAAPATSAPAASWSEATPNVELLDTGSDLVLVAEVPGVAANGLDLTVEGDRLTLTATPTTQVPKGLQPLHQECPPRRFTRSFVLSETIDSARISASVNDGVARITLPRRTTSAPRRIIVK